MAIRGWTVRAAYVAADKELKWGEYHHANKLKARNVFRNLQHSAERIEVLKDGKLQFECRRSQLVQADEFAAVLLKAFLDG